MDMSDSINSPGPSYSYISFAVGTGLLILLLAFGPFAISIWVVTTILIIAGAILYKFYRAQNEEIW